MIKLNSIEFKELEARLLNVGFELNKTQTNNKQFVFTEKEEIEDYDMNEMKVKKTVISNHLLILANTFEITLFRSKGIKREFLGIDKNIAKAVWGLK